MNYTFTLHVDDVFHFGACNPLFGFQCASAPSYSGTFSTTGTIVNDLLLRIGDVFYDQNNPLPASDFFGTRGSAGGFGPLELIAGELHGGIFGAGDIPFVDFQPIVAPDRFSAFDGTTAFSGPLTVTQVTEPATALLLAAALVITAVRRLK
jgi:hypothetical protein